MMKKLYNLNATFTAAFFVIAILFGANQIASGQGNSNINDLKGYSIVASDGEIGNIEEFNFDDSNYVLRYLGGWLTDREL